MLTYRSNHPNHVHQLTVSVSKHYYLTKEGRLKYQQKPMEVSLEKSTGGERNHIIHYSIRDHCSGLFYSEIATASGIMPVEQFLNRAWRRKTDYIFCGMPELLTVPRTVEAFFPSVKESVTALGIKLIEVTSGFQGGVRDVRTIEDALKVVCQEHFREATSWVFSTLQSMSKRKSRNGIDDKASLWQKHVPPISEPPDRWGYEA